VIDAAPARSPHLGEIGAVAAFPGAIDVLGEGALVALHDVPSPALHRPPRGRGQRQHPGGGGESRQVQPSHGHTRHGRRIAGGQELDILAPRDEPAEQPHRGLLDPTVERMSARDDGDPHRPRRGVARLSTSG
jgi:hypothetical protein